MEQRSRREAARREMIEANEAQKRFKVGAALCWRQQTQKCKWCSRRLLPGAAGGATSKA